MTLYSTHNNPFFVIDLKSLTTENKIMKTLFHKYSENIAGIVSLSGSLILIILGDIKSIMAAIAFTVAELILTRYGNKTFGYSLAALFFIIGNTLLIYSISLTGDTAVQFALWGMSFAWFIGFCRYFIEKIGRINIADNLPAVTGSLNIIIKIPGIIFAYNSGDYVVATAIFLWMLADVLAGRLQEKVKLFINLFR
jgi:hypothetical protein